MPGGKGNIKPSDGKQFSSTYQPKEKWTEKKALELGEEMINWLNETDVDGKDMGNVLFEEFLIIKKKLYPEIIAYLKDKFTSFLKLYKIARKTQEVKISKYGLSRSMDSSMCKFLLSATHGLTEKTEVAEKSEVVISKETINLIKGELEDEV